MKQFILLPFLSVLLLLACNEDTSSNYEKGLRRAEKGDYEHALKYFDQAIKSDSTNAEYYFARACYAKQKLGDYHGSVEDYTRAIELGEENNAEVYSNRGYSYYKQKKYREAISDIQKALSLNPNDPLIYKYRAELFIQIKNTAMACKDLETALELGYTEKYDNQAEELLETHCK